MKLLIPEKDSHTEWHCINQGKIFHCHNEEISKEEHQNNSGWNLVLPKRDSKRAFHLRMKRKHFNRRKSQEEN